MPVTIDLGTRRLVIESPRSQAVVVREGPQGIQGERGPTGVQGPPGDLTKEVADATYERKLIDTAVWRVDAGALSADGLSLIDLSGGNRPAVFGAGAAAPLVLPYDGEPYLYLPSRADSASDSINSSVLAVACSDMQVTIHGAFQSRPIATQIFQVGDSSTGWILKWSPNGGSVVSIRYGAQTVSATLPSGALTKAWNRFTHTTAAGRTVWEQSDDGAAWEAVGTASHGTCVPSTSSRGLLGGGSSAHHAAGTRHRVDMHLDGVLVHQMIPSNHHTNYTMIRNTGTAGGDWTISRAATGFKTAVVDRPLLLFGGGQSMAAGSPVKGGGTRLRARRAFGSGGTIGVVATVHDGTAPALSGVTEEYLAGAIFDRALTDAEVAQATQDLLGTPHTEQPDPHPQYVLESAIGNLLTANQATGAGTSGFEAVGAGVSVSTTSAHAAHGTEALLISTTSAAPQARTTAIGGIEQGRVYTGSVAVKSISGATSAGARLYFFNASDAVIGGNYDGPSTWITSSGFTTVSVTAVAPPGAVRARLYVHQSNAAASGHSIAADCWGLWLGAGGDWAMPGTPIVNQGIRTSRPNVDDRLVETWDGTKWITTYYDSGWRSLVITSGGAVTSGAFASADWGPDALQAGFVRVRRVGNIVHARLQWVVAKVANPTGSIVTLPSGFGSGESGTYLVHCIIAPSYANISLNAYSTGLTRHGGAVALGDQIGRYGAVQVSWPTNDPIPTSLPGTLLSPAP